MMILDRGIAILDLMPAPVRHSRGRRRPLPGFVSRQVVAARRWFLSPVPGRGRRGAAAVPAGIAVICGGCERVRGDYCVARDDFPYLCVEFVAAGCGTVELRGRRHDLVPGTVFAYGPGVPHTIRTDPRLRLRKYYVDFLGADAWARMKAAQLQPGSIRRVTQPQEVGEIFDLLQQCGLAQSSHAAALASQLVGLLLTKIAERGVRTDAIDPPGGETFERLRRFLAAERQRFTSVAAACREFGITPAYGCRLFRRFDSTSPYQFLLRQRMGLAAEFLSRRDRGGDRPLVKEVAARLGFADQYQFSRAFKRVFGTSPARFQRGTATRRDA
jgi:AraC-like DNA-binding protein